MAPTGKPPDHFAESREGQIAFKENPTKYWGTGHTPGYQGFLPNPDRLDNPLVLQHSRAENPKGHYQTKAGREKDMCMESYNRTMPGYMGHTLGDHSKYGAEKAGTAPVKGDYICIGFPSSTSYAQTWNESSRLGMRDKYPGWVPGAGGATGTVFRDFFTTTQDAKFLKEGMSPSGAGVLNAGRYNNEVRQYAGLMKLTKNGKTMPDGRKYSFNNVTSPGETGHNARQLLQRFNPGYTIQNSSLGGPLVF